MITRAQIRRQLRAQGGIMNTVPREGFFLGGVGDFFGDVLGKAGKAVKKVVGSPIGRAALLGIGAFGLPGGAFGMKGFLPQGMRSLSGLGSKLFGASSIPGIPDRISGKGTMGLLGKLGLTKGGGSKMPTILGAITGGSLLTYFMGKGATEEEAEDLIKDVYRGEGIGFDQIRADINKYRSGELNQQQMFDKNYRFLTPRSFLAKDGGKPKDKIIIPPKKPKLMTEEELEEKYPGLARGEIYDYEKKKAEAKKNKKAEGGRIGYSKGSADSFKKLKKKMGAKSTTFKSTRKFKPFVIDPDSYFFDAYKRMMEKNKKAEGGIMSMPMGNMRRNRAGVMERDYRDEGGFVPVGVKEKADDVPAMLSKNEFVMTADAVRGAGDGNIKKGAQRMYDLMKQNEGKVA